jgi:hypothetical protein
VPEQYKRKPNIECLVCKKYIYRRPSEITENKNRVFCSAKCYGVSCRKETFCVICGKSILAGLNKKTCSRLCSNKNRVGVQYKSNQPRNKAVTLRRLKISLLESRGQKCERCNYNKSEILQVHHKNRDRRNNNLENLELICPNCHYEEHYL